MLYSVYAVLGVCCTRCMLYSVYTVLGVCCTRCMLYSVYAVLVRGSPLTEIMINNRSKKVHVIGVPMGCKTPTFKYDVMFVS